MGAVGAVENALFLNHEAMRKRRNSPGRKQWDFQVVLNSPASAGLEFSPWDAEILAPVWTTGLLEDSVLLLVS